MTDDAYETIAFVILMWTGFAFLTSYVAGQKGHPRGEWFAWGAVFGIFALIAAFATKPRDPVPAGAVYLPSGPWECSCGAQNPSVRATCYRCSLPPIRSDYVETAPQVEVAAAGGAKEVARLADLHAAGHLSDDEFAAAKKRALGL